MANPEHLKILNQGFEAWNKWRKENPNIKPDLNRADLRRVHLSRAHLGEADLRVAQLLGTHLVQANLIRSDLSGANLSGADLTGANLNWAGLRETNLSRANLHSTNLSETDLWGANLTRADLTDADLNYACLAECDLSGATLTGAKLYGTARDDWVIKDVQCKYVYWDYEGKQRCPKDRDLEPGEFERLYVALPTIEYVFEQRMSPIDPLIMDRVVQAIREKRPEFDIKIDSINARGLAPSIKFTVEQEEHKEPALEQVRKGYQAKIAQLEAERDRYYRLVSRALDAPKETKLTIVEAGAIAALDSSTINIEHINCALELQKAIADEPEESESFAKVAKKTALDIIGGAIRDVAEGQVKEAAKQIVELGKDLGPVIINTAAYAFFKSCFGQ